MLTQKNFDNADVEKILLEIEPGNGKAKLSIRLKDKDDPLFELFQKEEERERKIQGIMRNIKRLFERRI
ncbi:MAG: hypothetical protein KJ737_12055 [Proteobacteria bacterium]|nr:hypothetical protein [Pseudomonadota bacterium]